MNKYTDLMVDIETLGTRPGSVITQIGAVYFSRKLGVIRKRFCINIDIDDCLKNGLVVDSGALKFWMNMGVHSFLEPPILTLKDALGKFVQFCTKYGDTNNVIAWAHGSFDFPKLEYAYNAVNIKYPFHYRNMRDIRTLVDLTSVDYLKIKENASTTHNALEDAMYQAQYTSDLLRYLEAIQQ